MLYPAKSLDSGTERKKLPGWLVEAESDDEIDVNETASADTAIDIADKVTVGSRSYKHARLSRGQFQQRTGHPPASLVASQIFIEVIWHET